MTPTNTEALAAELEKQRVSNWIHSTGAPPIIHGTKPDPLCQQAAAELRRLAAVEAERDKFASESAHHFIRGREWAERAGQMEAERDALRADAERYRWLRSQDDWRYRTYPGSMASSRWTSGNSPSEIDAAIDAAMKGTA